MDTPSKRKTEAGMNSLLKSEDDQIKTTSLRKRYIDIIFYAKPAETDVV